MKPEDGYITFIVNPKSGASSGKRTVRVFQKYLRARDYVLKVHPTTSLDNAYDLSVAACKDHDCGMVIVTGGDGTVRKVVHGMVGSTKPLMIIPGGTENLLASELGFDERVATLIDAFEAAHTRPLDLCTINGNSFTCVAGFGFDGEVVERVCNRREGHIDYFDYADPLWQTFWNYRFRPLCVNLDGEEIFNGPGLAFVGNISRYATGLQVLRHADFGDGLLDVCIYRCAHRPHLVKHSIMTVLKRHAKCRDVIYRQGKTVTVSSPSARIKTEVDGDPGPRLPAEIRIIPQAISVLVPKETKPAGIRTRILRAIG